MQLEQKETKATKSEMPSYYLPAHRAAAPPPSKRWRIDLGVRANPGALLGLDNGVAQPGEASTPEQSNGMRKAREQESSEDAMAPLKLDRNLRFLLREPQGASPWGDPAQFLTSTLQKDLNHGKH